MIEESIQETACLYVLGLLSESESVSFEADAAANPELQKLVADLRNSAASLAAGISPRSTTAVLRTEILKKIASRARKDGRRSSLPAMAPVLVSAAPAAGGGSALWVGWAAAACFLIGSVVLYSKYSASQDAIARVQSDNRALNTQVKTIEGEKNEQEKKFLAVEVELMALKSKDSERQKEIAELKGKEATALATVDALKTREAKAIAESKSLAESLKALTAASMADSDRLQRQLDETKKELELRKTLLRAAFTRLALTEKIAAESDKAIAMAAFDKDAKKGVLKVDRLAKLDANKDYELWIIDGDKTVSCGIFKTDAEGGATYEFTPGPYEKVNAFAVSVERAGGNGNSPEGPVIMKGSF
jgi:anti-sigma-K factor RskA